jgi:hypothetical protein
MSTSAQFASTPVSAAANVATANTARDGTGTITTLYTAPASGARIDDIWMKAKATTTAGMLRFWLHDGANYRLLREILVTAITASGTVASWESALQNLGIVLQSGWSIRVSTNNAESFDVSITKGGTF